MQSLITLIERIRGNQFTKDPIVKAVVQNQHIKNWAGSETVDVNPINELTTKLNAFLDIVKKLRSDIQSVKPSRGGKKSDKG